MNKIKSNGKIVFACVSEHCAAFGTKRKLVTFGVWRRERVEPKWYACLHVAYFNIDQISPILKSINRTHANINKLLQVLKEVKYEQQVLYERVGREGRASSHDLFF